MIGRFVSFYTVTVVVGVLCASSAISAGEVRYLAWNPQEERALVQSAAGTQWVAVGDPVPAFGHVASIGETHIVFERVLAEAERAALVSQGAIPHWADQIEVLRWDLRFHGIPVSSGSSHP